MSALQLPALTVEAKAELVANNFPAFEKAFRDGLDGLRYELINDDDFEKAKEDIDSLKEAEKSIKAVDQEIVNGSADIKTLRESLAKLGEEARQFRLAREKEVRERDEEIKAKIIEDALATIDHPKREKFRSQVEGGVKGKRKLSTKKEGAEKVAKGINDSILKTRNVLDQFENEHGKLLIPDRVDLELQDVEGVTNELRHRLEKQRDEEEKQRLKDEAEKARQEAEAAKAKGEEHGKTALIDTDETLGKAPAQPMPEPPKVGTIPVGRKPLAPQTPPQAAPTPEPASPAPAQEESPKEEMARFLSIVTSAFAPVKEARAQLKHPENIEAAGEFAKSLGEAWATFKSKLS